MVDRRKVIKGLKCCASSACLSCSYGYRDSHCMVKMAFDALELLKEQEAVKPKHKECVGEFIAGQCPTCGAIINNFLNAKACGKCGQAVTWK